MVDNIARTKSLKIGNFAVLRSMRAVFCGLSISAERLRGVVRCPCGSKMSTQSNKPEGKRTYHYYVCRRRRMLGKKSPCSQKSLKATEVESAMWHFVSDLLKEPERIRAGMDILIEQERAEGARDPAAETKIWADKVAECDRLRSAY